jgi:hypothetical protein
MHHAPTSRMGPPTKWGVRPGPGYEPLRTPFGNAGVPGAGVERNVRDLDLTKNRHPATSRPVAQRANGERAIQSQGPR